MDPLVKQIEDIVRECAQIMMNAKRSEEMVDEKSGKANFVTTYDKATQNALEEKLLKLVPGAVFVGEEEDVHASIAHGDSFIVDPIDGTTNFIKDLHMSCISVAMLKEGEQYIGVIYNPYLDEMFYAQKGQGAYLNGKPIHVSDEPLSNGIVLFGSSPYYKEVHKKSFEMLFDYFNRALDLRRSGSAALDFCSIAAGRAELYFELILSPWDFAAGSLIVEEAGGVVTTVEGGRIDCGQPCSVLVTNKKVREDLNN